MNRVSETLLAASVAAGVLAGTGCSDQEDWSDKRIGCEQFMDRSEDASVQSLAKAVRLCYDSLPEELRIAGESNSINVRIPTGDGKEVVFGVVSEAPVESDPGTYVEGATLIDVALYPIRQDISASLVPDVSLRLYDNDGVPFATWYNAKNPVPHTSIYAGAAHSGEESQLRVEPWKALKGGYDPNDQRVIKCVQDTIRGNIAETLRSTDTQRSQPTVGMPNVTSTCRQV